MPFFLHTTIFLYAVDQVLFVLVPPHREGLSPCCPDEHELCHLGTFGDEHSASMQFPGAHEPSISQPPHILHHFTSTVRRRHRIISLSHPWKSSFKSEILTSLLSFPLSPEAVPLLLVLSETWENVTCVEGPQQHYHWPVFNSIHILFY